MRSTYSVLVENNPGVLARVAGLFSRRGYNIDSLSVSRTDDPTVSRMTIVVEGEKVVLEQVTKQLRKLVDVIRVRDITDEPHVDRELVLIKVNADSGTRGDIMQIVEIFRGRIVDVGEYTSIVEVTGDEGKINAIENALKPFGIIELVRTGKVAMQRGTRTVLVED
ncbi:acetolactate synthase small subunit [Candidatus Desulforudis audaxviator]|uniref:Acetolactate synthase small subunit n=1 Tax=Desulforudis audaxviator (strain MP104C) TaxID=477974 RepID=B1I1D9_DESAP|nr:acetolactate synthase small subunit [Candidatus Desulforudis audaxviator]ACA58911.1 acetolactate synthase, small subunit [Candidatus Desulforudis audaxviator MP104C]AZK58930.1 Acetolactate synthase small subunit [Candidatus Desulforudis audaxviator]